MKLINKFLGIVSLFFLFSCEEPPVVFTGPQPVDLQAAPYISPIYRGTFFCESDSSTVYVKARTIHKERLYAFSITKEEIDTIKEVRLEGDLLMLKGFETPIPVEHRNDTLFAEVMLQDTLFEMGPGQVLKTFQGHQILNKELADKKWEVLILSLENDFNLTLSAAVFPDDIQVLQAITPVEDISTEEQVQLRLSPSQIEFSEIFRRRLIFQACDQFTRIKTIINI